MNKNCGAMWLDPAPLSSEISKTYINYFTHQDCFSAGATYVKSAYRFVRDCYLSLTYNYFRGELRSRLKFLGYLIYFFPGRRADIDFSVMYLPSKPQGYVLEVGCGSGAMLKFLSSLGWKVKGIDFDSIAVSNARSKFMDVDLGSLKEQNYPSNSFDAIILSHVIEHVPDPYALMSECYRVLKPGGIISVVTPNIESIGSRFFGSSWLHLDPPRHLVLFNVRSFHSLVKKCGFINIQIRTVVRDANSVFWASHSIAKYGKFKMGSQPGVFFKTIMLLLRFAEWCSIRIFRDNGEEISFRGSK